MYTYIQKDIDSIYTEIDFLLDENYQTGTSWEDYLKGCWVLLSHDQILFKNSNIQASVQEVFEMKIFEPSMSDDEKLSIAKRNKIQQIIEQDKNSNIFYIENELGKIKMWLDKNTRNSLLNVTIPSEKSLGKENINLWYEGEIFNDISPVSVNAPISWLEDNIKSLEIYAKKTYDLKNTNISLVINSSTIEDVEDIDIFFEFPEPLVFKLNNNK